MNHLKKLLLFIFLAAGIAFSFTGKAKDKSAGTFTDSRDGHVYKTIKIGDQTWMAENLDFATETGSWCIDCEKYGRLYNFETAKKACPPGWHIPTNDEWKQLIKSLGGEKAAGTKMKSGDLWEKSDFKATNSSGFNGLPGGEKGTRGDLRNEGESGTWWTSTLAEEPANWTWALQYNRTDIFCLGLYKSSGFSVRCVKD